MIIIAKDPTPEWMRSIGTRGSCIAQSAETVEILDAVHRTAGGESVFVDVDRRAEQRLLTKRQEEVFGYLSEDTPSR